MIFFKTQTFFESTRCYETPGGTILRAAHVDLEGLTLDREVRRIRDQFSQRLSEIIYNGFWYSPEREFIMTAVEHSQKGVTGSVKSKYFSKQKQELSFLTLIFNFFLPMFSFSNSQTVQRKRSH